MPQASSRLQTTGSHYVGTEPRAAGPPDAPKQCTTAPACGVISCSNSSWYFTLAPITVFYNVSVILIV